MKRSIIISFILKKILWIHSAGYKITYLVIEINKQHVDQINRIFLSQL